MAGLLHDFVNAAAEQVLMHQFTVTLHPDRLTAADSELQPLAWDSIPYGRDEIHRIPDDKRGIYAFAISYSSDVPPLHSYLNTALMPAFSINDLDAETRRMQRAFS